MTNAEAIETLRANYPDACYEQLREAVDVAIEALNAQGATGDTISRQAAIDELMCLVKQHECDLMPDLLHWTGVKAMLESLPSAQPTQKNDSNALGTLDCVSRQAAIKEIEKYFCDLPIQGRFDILSIIKNLPSAQPERKECEEREQGKCPWYAG